MNYETMLARLPGWVDVSQLEYNKVNKPAFDLAISQILEFKDYRYQYAKVKKSDLAKSIAELVVRCNAEIDRHDRAKKVEQLVSEQLAQKKELLIARCAFLNSIADQRDQFLTREWECLEVLIIDGVITKDNAESYGIVVPVNTP